MALHLRAGDIITASAKDPVFSLHHEHWVLTVLLYTVHVARRFQKLLSGVLLPLFFQLSTLLNLACLMSLRTARAVIGGLSHSLRLSARAAWTTWHSKQARRLKKKLEFEFFTLILGTGGNKLCLVIFWPGWVILGLGAVVVSACEAK